MVGCLVGNPNGSELGYGIRPLTEIFLSGPRLGEVEGNLVGHQDGEVLGRSDGGCVGRSAKAFHSDHQTASGLGDV